MADITTYPLIDKFETTLAQSWDGSTGDVFLNTLPDFTFPSGVTTYIVVNPGKTNMQVAEIDSMDSTNTTVNVSSISVDKSAGESYTAQSHSVGSVVRISNNYQFWKDVVDSVNGKVDTNDQIDFNYYADATARDADIPSPTIGKDYAFLEDTGLLYYYGSGGWTAFDTGTATANASTTVAGILEIATDAEVQAETDTGGTGAKLVATPSQLSPSKLTEKTSIVGDDVVRIADSEDADSAKKVKASRFSSLVPSASETTEGLVEKATDGEVTAQTDNTRYITSQQLGNEFGKYGIKQIAGSEYTLVSNNSLVETSSETFVKLKQSTVSNVGPNGTFRLEVECNNVNNTYGYYQIRINGTLDTSFQSAFDEIGTFSYTGSVSGLSDGDTVEIWGSTGDATYGDAGAQNFVLKYGFEPIRQDDLSGTADS